MGTVATHYGYTEGAELGSKSVSQVNIQSLSTLSKKLSYVRIK